MADFDTPLAKPGEGFRTDPDRWVGRLCLALRAEGLGVALSESVLAGHCVRSLDRDDEWDIFNGLRAAFCSSEGDLPVFDRCFWQLWGETLASSTEQRAVGTEGPVGPGQPEGGAGPELAERATEPSDLRSEAFGSAYSAAEHLTRRSFADVSDQELRELDAWIERLMLRLSTRRSRRMEPGGRRGPVDLRRSAASAVRTEGEWVRLLRRRRRRDPPRLVVLCDVSGSMERYSRFLVRFLLATGRAREIETFAFSTRLTHLTPWLVRSRVDDALAELRARGWSSGTRIGESLETFLRLHGRSMLGQRTLVVILSDGLDQGEVEPLERAMREIQRRARRVIWLNPLLESSRYAPEARGMRAALPHVDVFASAHNLAALRELPDLLRLQG
ncbi:MAG: VWA domain-containing protein [Gemmatimonadota bacterium]|nr:VWA domain-containing protein [Gemmatimonadota bacterium]